MKKILRIFYITLIAGLLISCSEKKKEEEKFVRPIKYQEIGYLGGEKIRTFNGTAQTEKIINLSFRSSGIITLFDIRLGQKVKKGELLAELDNVRARLSYEQALTQLNSAESQMNTAKLALNRVRSLFEKGSTSLSDFESAKNAYKTAEEGYQSAKRGTAIQEEQIRYGYLYAPEDGLISAVISEKDENVGPGQVVATLNAGTSMEIVLGIPESVINGVKEGMNVSVNFSSLPNREYSAKVTEVAPAVDINKATYPVKVTITNPSKEIKSGMAANITFNFGELKNGDNVLVVPSIAVGEDSNGQFVFLIEQEGDVTRIKKQKVIVGTLTSEGFEVIAGLSLSQKIAIAGLHTLLDGQEIKL